MKILIEMDRKLNESGFFSSLIWFGCEALSWRCRTSDAVGAQLKAAKRTGTALGLPVNSLVGPHWLFGRWGSVVEMLYEDAPQVLQMAVENVAAVTSSAVQLHDSIAFNCIQLRLQLRFNGTLIGLAGIRLNNRQQMATNLLWFRRIWIEMWR